MFLSLKALESFPYMYENVLKQIIYLLRIFGKHIADRIDSPFVLPHNSRKFFLVVVHKSGSVDLFSTLNNKPFKKLQKYYKIMEIYCKNNLKLNSNT